MSTAAAVTGGEGGYSLVLLYLHPHTRKVFCCFRKEKVKHFTNCKFGVFLRCIFNNSPLDP